MRSMAHDEPDTWPRQITPGVTVFLTGLPAAGKSTLAQHLADVLTCVHGRRVTVLDGDAVRERLSPNLGFAREDRDVHIARIAFVAAEVTRHGGIAICAAIAPYDEARRRARRDIEALGGFVLVHVSTPVAVCEARDPRGLYARARTGQVPGFTGVSDAYEPPTAPDLAIDTSRTSSADGAAAIVTLLQAQRHLRA